jgi:NitT/TauT family transport system permease protein
MSGPVARIAWPAGFGVLVLLAWEAVVHAFGIPPAILPAPTAIGAAFARSTDILWIDFVQTVLKGALTGLLIGAAAGLVAAIAIDRSDFLRRGLMPVANFVAALPIVGIAPIMVMWFGFDWQSKAAVVVVMVFFPLLVNTLAGLQATDRMQRDLMRTYSASYWQTLGLLR